MHKKFYLKAASLTLMSSMLFSTQFSAHAEEDYVANDGIVENQEYPELAESNPEIQGKEATEAPESGKLELDQSKLKTIDEALYDTEERVFGKDERVKVSNYTSTPYKQVVLLNITFSNGLTYIGSGTMVGNDTVLTAGHNLYSKEFGWAKNVTVYAGIKGNNYKIGKAKSKKLMVLKPWQNSQNSEYDLGAIKLDSNLGKKTGTLSLTSSMKVNDKIETSGFPGDKGGATQYKSTDTIKSITVNNLFYLMDTNQGQSGSSVRDKHNKVIGVHTYGSSEYNGATKLNPINIDYIKHWIGTPVGHSYNHKVKVTRSKIIVWGNLEFTSRKDLRNIKVGNIYTAKYLYNHPNGQTYYSLYDSKNKWVGYFNSRDVTKVK